MAITAPPEARTVTLSIDGQSVTVREARPQPRPARPPDQTTGQTVGAGQSPDDAIGS